MFVDELIPIHLAVINLTSTSFQRYLYNDINGQNQSIRLLGAMGVGKTTPMYQHLKNKTDLDITKFTQITLAKGELGSIQKLM